MTLKRRILAKVDRRLLAELDHNEVVQLVKVPVSDAVWSTWRRYCDAAAVPMGRGLAILLQQELATVVDEDIDGLTESIAEREAQIETREAELAEREAEVARREADVSVREHRLGRAERRTTTGPTGSRPKLGRNEPCWCGSGKKYKTCHGSSR